MTLCRDGLCAAFDLHPAMWHPRSMARASLISAALRHVRDAEHLFASGEHRSIEQALHLAGFGPECARKACVDEEIADKALGHDFRGGDDAVVDLLLALDPSASRYRLDEHTLPHREQYWSLDCRYMATGALARSEEAVAAVIAEARGFVDGCVEDLWCDGALPPGGLL
jgi:hypothetical protein